MNERNDLTLMGFMAHDVGILIESHEQMAKALRKQNRINKLFALAMLGMTAYQICLFGEVGDLRTQIEKLKEEKEEENKGDHFEAPLESVHLNDLHFFDPSKGVTMVVHPETEDNKTK